MTEVRIHPEAEAETTEAARWYAERSKPAAQRFLDAVEGALERMSCLPDAFPLVPTPGSKHTLRRVALRRSGVVRRARLGVVLVAALLAGCRSEATTVLPEAGDPPATTREGKPRSAAREASTPAVEPGWTLVAEEDGIMVTSRPSERSALPIFRGVGRVDAPLLEVLAVVTDAERHHEWIFSCSGSALIAQTSEASGILYNRTDAPWPVPDRDVVLDSRVEVLDGEREVIVRFSATPHPDRPPIDGVVRMPYLRGHYHLWAEGDARTRVEYQVDSDPGGTLPTWLASRGTREMPLETLRALRTQLARTRGLYDDRIAEIRGSLFQG